MYHAIKTIRNKILDFLDGDDDDSLFLSILKLILTIILFPLYHAYFMISSLMIILAPFASVSVLLEYVFPKLVENGGIIKNIVYFSIVAILYIEIYLFFKSLEDN